MLVRRKGKDKKERKGRSKGKKKSVTRVKLIKSSTITLEEPPKVVTETKEVIEEVVEISELEKEKLSPGENTEQKEDQNQNAV